MRLMVIGASRGLGRSFVEGLAQPGDTVFGVSRSRPDSLLTPADVAVQWIEADLSEPEQAADKLHAECPPCLDTLIYNVGIWEPEAFSEGYEFLGQADSTSLELVQVNISSTLLILKRLLPRLLEASSPRLLLTGSTSALPGNGRPEVAFGACKAALNGIAGALREGYRDKRLGVTLLQLGYLNTEDALNVPRELAAARGDGELVPVHDVVAMVKTMLSLSPSSFVRELVLPAIADPRF